MGRAFNTAFSLAASVVEHSNRKKAIKRIGKVNEANRNIQTLGSTNVDQLLPSNYQMGNISISGGNLDVRNKLIVQNCRQDVSVGIPTLVIHEGNYRLEKMLQMAFSGHRYFRLINAANPYYDPIFRLNDTELGHFVSDAAPSDHPINSAGALYVKALSSLLRKKGITPYMRMLAGCPHNSINSIIQNMEASGIITADEANAYRNDIMAGSNSRADIEYFFHQIELESSVLAWKSNLSRCTSIFECILRNGIMSIDVSSCTKLNQLSLIATEIEHCSRNSSPFRVIVDATSIFGNEKFISTLKNASSSIMWTISSPDIYRMIGGGQGELSTWLALSHRAILFSHGIKTSELLSVELGDYEHIDVIESKAGNNNIGSIGFHFGHNSSYSTSSKRERVLKPEEIEGLRENQFIMLDNYTSLLSQGVII